MWKITRALVLVSFALAVLALPIGADANTPGAPLAAAPPTAEAEVEAPWGALFDLVRSWFPGLWSPPEDTGIRSVSDASGHHMDPNGSTESTDDEVRRPGGAGSPGVAPGSAPEIL